MKRHKKQVFKKQNTIYNKQGSKYTIVVFQLLSDYKRIPDTVCSKCIPFVKNNQKTFLDNI